MTAAVASAERFARDHTPVRWWRDLLVPLPRATRFYLEAWLDWTDPRRRAGEVPLPRPSLSLAVQATIDESLLTAFKIGRPPQSPEAFSRIEQEVTDALEMYARRDWLADPEAFHRPPPALRSLRCEPARAGRISYEHCSFESGYAPFPGEPGRDRWLAYESNRTAHAWMLRHDHDAPWLVCIHGAGMGQPIVDLECFRARWLHEKLGLNVMVPVQPLHGPRGTGGRLTVGFPTDDLLDNVHGVSQSVWDVRRLLSWIRARSDAPIGLHGLSLGGYAAAVLAGLVEDLACVVAGVPAVDFATLFEAHAPNRAADGGDLGSLAAISRRVHHVISPLVLRPLVPRERRFVYAGLADRLVDPRDQVRVLWEHWDRPRIAWFHGSHIGFYGSREVRAFVLEALMESRMTSGAVQAAVA